MTTYNGYTKDLSPEEKLKNEIETVKKFLQDDPNNEYWKNRLAGLTCSCLEYVGDNDNCPIHGGASNNGGVMSNDEIAREEYDESRRVFSIDDYENYYQERGDLYAMGMGY